MTAFTSKFGGSPVQTSDVSYLAYTFTANAVMSWPQDSEENPVARIMDISTAAGVTVALPAANEVSPGLDTLLRNLGANDFTVLDNAGNVVATVRVGQIVLLYIVDNTTAAGAWRSVLFGVGSSVLDAASLQGLGLLAIGNTLAQAHPTVTFSADTTVLANNRASLLVWTGGSGSLTLPATNTIDNTFFFEVRNQGTGNLMIAAHASDFIDGSSSISLQPGESAFIHASPTNWHSVGRGRSAQFNFTQLIKTVTGGTVTLSAIEAANVVQKYVGALTSNQTIVLPAVVQVYYVSNATTGSHTLTFQSPTPGSTVTVPSNQNAILFCDGTNIINTSTTIAGFASLILVQGSQTTPPLTFTGNLNTGIYQPTTNTVAVTCNGVEVARFTPTGMVAIQPITLPALSLLDSSTTAATTAFVKGQGYVQSAAISVHLTGSTLTVDGSLTVGGPAFFSNSTLTTPGQFFISAANATTPIINFDAGDAIEYDRAANAHNFFIGNALIASIASSTVFNANELDIRGSAGSGLGPLLRMVNSNTGVGPYLRASATNSFDVINSSGSAVGLSVDDSGNVVVRGTATATGFNVSSAAALKNIQGDLLGEDAFKRVMSWMPKLYTLKAEEKARIRAGLVVEEAPVEITDGEGHIDIYAAMTEMGAALQYVARKVGLA